jgi:hypothetical protein
MMFGTGSLAHVAAGFALTLLGLSHALAPEKRDVIVTFNDIYVPPSDYNIPKTLYGRTVQLSDGTLLATW